MPETLRAGRAPLVEDVVVPGSNARESKFPVLEPGEKTTAKAGQAREIHARTYASGEQVAGAEARVVTAGDHVREPGRLQTPLLPRLTSHTVEAHRQSALILVAPVLAAVLLDHMGRGFTKLHGDPAGPDISGFHDVIVHAEQVIADVGHRGLLTERTWYIRQAVSSAAPERDALGVEEEAPD